MVKRRGYGLRGGGHGLAVTGVGSRVMVENKNNNGATLPAERGGSNAERRACHLQQQCIVLSHRTLSHVVARIFVIQ